MVMKFLKITAAILFLAILTACNSGQSVQTSETVSESETSAVTASATTAITTETKTETVPETEPAETAEENDSGYVEVSSRNEFIDFEYIEDYHGTTDIGDLADKAVEFLKTTECYAYVIKEADDYNEENSQPELSEAFPEDYDGDGRTETFIVIDIPYKNGVTCSFLVFADSDCNMTVMNYYLGTAVGYEFINYGKNKQFIMGCGGYYGAATHTEIYGMRDGKAVELYGGRIGFAKQDCFLFASGWQGSGAFMYFDTVALEYRAITGERISSEEIIAMDKTEVIPKYLDAEGYYDVIELNPNIRFYLIGKKYYWLDYHFMGGGELFTYENGVFVPVKDAYIRLSNPEIHDLPLVVDIDYDKAVSEMQPPEEPYGQVSEGHEFIDYNFISNYPGTTDIGSLEDKALEFLKATDFYADSIKNADRFKWESFMHEAIGDAEFKEKIRKQDEERAAAFAVYLDENGNAQPKLSAAYPADYDGDGREETFIIVDMPVIMNDNPVIRSFTVFSDSSGEMQLLTDFSGAYPVVLLDYGKFKHIIIGGYGIMGADDHTVLYGVINGKAVELSGGRVSYYKEDCFLASYGWQGGGGFMYYDTVKQGYYGIYSASVSIEKIKEMDKDNVFEKYYEWYEEEGYAFFTLIGGKYYCASISPMDTGVIYTYEDGKFIRQEHCHARSGGGANIDIDKVLAEMKPVSNPISPVSKGSEFIDFEFIESYQGTADIGDLGDKAVNYIKDGYFCETANKYANEFSDEKFAAYFDSDGNIVPKFLTAYPNDYDGDGKTETFIIVEMPYYMGLSETAVINDYLIFADSDGNVKMCNQFSGFDPEKDVTLLNYGKYKHILFNADGYNEGDKTTVLCGAHTWSSRAVTYYDSDNYGGGGAIKKDGCFLSVSDSYASEYFMYFDTVTQEYVTLLGKNYGSSMPAPLGTNQNAEIKTVQK